MKKAFEINNILVPIDFSEVSLEVLNHAASIAKKAKASLHIVHVMNVSAQVFPFFTENIDMSKLKTEVRGELSTIAEKVSQSHGVQVNLEIREGTIAKEIVQMAKSVNADMIVMGTHGASGFEEFFIGSNANRVVTSSTCPVLTMRGGIKELDFSLIALPIDSSRHTRDKVSEVSSIAKLFGSTVRIVGLITEDHESEKSVFNLKIKQVEDYLKHRDIPFESKILHGEDISEMTSSYAQTIDAGLIAIMTEQEASTGLLVGPHAQRIVNHSKIPILSVTPIESLDLSSDGSNLRPFHS